MRRRLAKPAPFRSVGLALLEARLTKPPVVTMAWVAASIGVSPQAVSHWVHRLTKPSVAARAALLALFGIPIESWDMPAPAQREAA